MGILQFFLSWLLVSLILVPVGTVISGLFAENIFFAVKDLNKYNWKYQLKDNSFIISLKYAIFSALRSMVINILILPLYLIIPVANIFIFIFVNAFLVGREYCGNFLVHFLIQFFEKSEVKKNFMLLDGKIYVIGLFIVFLYTIPILNLIAPIIGNILTSHLILGNKLMVVKINLP
jgi:CysZ protein